MRHRLEWFGLVLLTNSIPLLPRRFVAGLARVLGAAAFRFDKRGRAISEANIAAAFPDRYTLKEQREIARQSYCNFSRTMLDLFWGRALNQNNYRRYIKVENAAVLKVIQARGESAVLVCIHHGNFEWASLAAGFEGAAVMIVTENFKNQRLTDCFRTCREVSGHRIISQDASMLRLLKHTRKGGLAGMLIDLNLRPSEAATVIEAFGLKMCVTFLHSVLVQRGPARVIPTEAVSLADGTCRVVFHEPLTITPDANFQQIAQQCWDFFEPTVRARPQEWLWAYRHWRYKPQRADREYPFYATECKEFERLLEAAAAKAIMPRAA